METPFNMIIVGMTACGKTYYLLDMIVDDYKNHFEYIILLCPTYSWNKTYIEWKYNEDPDFIAIECKHEHINLLLKYITNIYKGSNTLIILDDCASSQDIKNRTSELVNLAFSARHYNLSTIVITQQLTSIAKPYRENISKLVTFYNTNKNDMKTIIDDYLNGVSKEEINDTIHFLKNNKYARLEINLRHPYDFKLFKPVV